MSDPVLTQLSGILSPLQDYQFINSGAFLTSVLAPLVENDLYNANMIEGELQTWGISVAADNALTFDYSQMRLGINYAAFAADANAIGVDGSVIANYIRGDNTYILINPWIENDITKGITIGFTDVFSQGKASCTAPIGSRGDTPGYLNDKFISIASEQIVLNSTLTGWGADNNIDDPVISLTIKDVDNRLAFVANAGTWGNYLLGGLAERTPELIKSIGYRDSFNEENEYQGLYSFFKNDSTVPVNPIWMQFYERRDLNVHTLNAQFDSTILNRLSRSIKLYPDDNTYEHYLDKISVMSNPTQGRFPLSLSKNVYSYSIYGENWPATWTNPIRPVSTALGFSMMSLSNAQAVAVKDNVLFVEQTYNVVKETLLKRDKGDWVLNTPNANELFRGTIWSMDQEFVLSKIIGIQLPGWLLNTVHIRIRGEYETLLKGVDMLKFSLPKGDWTFTLEYINA